MSEKIKLKPCPFCGSTFLGQRTIAGTIESGYSYETFIFCHECEAEGKHAYIGDECVAELMATKGWNERVEG